MQHTCVVHVCSNTLPAVRLLLQVVCSCLAAYLVHCFERQQRLRYKAQLPPTVAAMQGHLYSLPPGLLVAQVGLRCCCLTFTMFCCHPHCSSDAHCYVPVGVSTSQCVAKALLRWLQQLVIDAPTTPTCCLCPAAAFGAAQALLLLLHPAMVVAWIASGSLHGLMS